MLYIDESENFLIIDNEVHYLIVYTGMEQVESLII